MKAATSKLTIQMRALSDPTRRLFAKLLGKGKELSATQLELKAKLAQPTISHHMKIMKKAGLIETRRQGTWTYYSGKADVIRQVSKEIRALVE